MGGAIASYERSRPHFEALANADPANMEGRRDLAYFHENFGDALSVAGQSRSAAVHERIAIAMLHAIHQADPGAMRNTFISRMPMEHWARRSNE